jgi:glycosyltransferase involved in cell wall biosynthesis
MPCLNEAETIATCIQKARSFLESAGIDGEILIADNGSTDGSQRLAAEGGARVIDVPVRGYGAALIAGIRAAHGRYVIMGDADDSYDFCSLHNFVDALRSGSDLVMGNRFQGGIAPGAMPFLHRYLGNPVLSWLGRLFFHVPIGDFHCGLRGFNRESIGALGLVSPGMEFASEMVVKAALRGCRITEVPTTLAPDGRSRPPHLKTWTDGWRHLRFLLLHSPKWLFFIPGVTILLASSLATLLLLPGPVRVGHTTFDIHTMLATSFGIFLGLQLISFSVLARRYAAAEGFLPPVKRFPVLIEGLSLERLLQLALVLLIAGLLGTGWSILTWASTGFGSLEGNSVLRVMLISLVALASSVQIAASAFLASVFSLRGPVPTPLSEPDPEKDPARRAVHPPAVLGGVN